MKAPSITIEKAIFAHGQGGFFNDDQVAVRLGAQKNGEFYTGDAITHRYPGVRTPAESTSIGLLLSDGHVVWGDAMSVQYAGVEGRDPLFRTSQFDDAASRLVSQAVKSLPVSGFRAMSNAISELANNDSIESKAPVSYGLSQAFLRACAYTRRITPYEHICEQYGLGMSPRPMRLYSQSGDNRYANVDKMIQKRVDVLPHGLINSPTTFGAEGREFLAYAKWVRNRVSDFGSDSYTPELYFDLYGMPGIELGLEPERIATYLQQVEAVCAPYALTIESPANFGSPEAQLAGYARIRKELAQRESRVEISVDEWCNTLEDIQRFAESGATDVVQIKMPDLGCISNTIDAADICRANNVRAYVGGSCTETDLSARLAMHVAMAVGADMFLARPGMGVDEGLMIATNEHARIVSQLFKAR